MPERQHFNLISMNVNVARALKWVAVRISQDIAVKDVIVR